MEIRSGVAIRSCVSCGIRVGWRPAWIQTFRAIYVASDGIRLSGIAFNEDYRKRFVLPVEETARWDTICHGGFIHLWPTPDDIEQNAFLFHEACWNLLMEHFGPGELRLDRLFEVCSVLLKMRNIPCFGCEKPDPCDVPTIEDVVQSTSVIQKPKQRVANSLYGTQSTMTDPLGILPFEIREEIATYLSTAEMFNLRLASRAMLDIFASQTFWKTRFYVNQDCGFLGYLLTDLKKRKSCPTVDWQLLYRAADKIPVHVDQLTIRKQIWDMHQWLKTTATMKSTAEDHRVMTFEEERTRRWEWKVVQGAIFPDDETIVSKTYRYLEASYKQTISIPQRLTGIRASILHERDRTYITGMDLIREDNSMISVGYKLPGEHVMLAIRSLRGFEVAVGSGGIRALKPITTPNSSQWLGSPTDFDPRWHLQCDKACITSRLVSDVEIDALEFTFDQYKMISIAIGKRVSIAENKSLQDDFRQNALWYPHIPPPNLCLNEGSFMGEDPLISGYQPAYWTLFGGSDGHELARLTAISVDMLSYRMEFFYQDGQHPSVTFPLGYDPSGFIDEYLIKRESMFFIDGPGGERIDSLQVAVQVPTSDQNPHHRFKQGVPLRYKISTNRGRSLSLKDPRKYGEQYEQTLQTLSYERLDPAPGTTVVGFYAVQNYENEILSLGVISVAIEG